MKDDFSLTVLAGLLHDIGKFAQRASWRTGNHPQVGGEFARQFVPKPWPIMGHHDRPLAGRNTRAVALADRLSAGERLPAEEEQPRQLRSIFCTLQAEGQRAPDRYWPLQPLRMEETALFPTESLAESEAQEAYSALWKEFELEALRLREAHAPGQNLPVYLENLLLLLQRYAHRGTALEEKEHGPGAACVDATLSGMYPEQEERRAGAYRRDPPEAKEGGPGATCLDGTLSGMHPEQEERRAGAYRRGSDLGPWDAVQDAPQPEQASGGWKRWCTGQRRGLWWPLTSLLGNGDLANEGTATLRAYPQTRS